MKWIAVLTLCAMGNILYGQDKKKFNDTSFMQPVEVLAVRAGGKAPFAKTNITKKEIEKNNVGQDLPFLLNQTPSVVVNSDAGNGVGYTGIRIRGTDAARINVTINGIPYNDAESQGTFFVDLPDFASSVNSIQIQRGVGTSSNGAGAFGASINLSTNDINKEFYAVLNNSYGSFNTLKNTIQFGSGIIGNHFTIDGRLSKISSDGYIDRASSNLKSFYFSTAYADSLASLRLNIFSGKEKTYQAWNGVPESLLLTNRKYNPSGMEQPDTPYENETDNYTQTHYQLFFNKQVNRFWKFNTALFFTKGKGYYEQYKADRLFSEFALPDYFDGMGIIKKTDVVRRLWLDNNFYGNIFSFQHQKNKTQVTIGGGWNQYDGHHFGEIIWAKVQDAIPKNYRWYDLPAAKKDFSLYTKWAEQLSNKWQTYIDVQYRNIHYTIDGFRDNPNLKIVNTYSFLNPKLGVTYNYNNWQLYGSFAVAHKEPNRDDFEASSKEQPKPEKLYDWELGVEKASKNYSFGAYIYIMNYIDQLVLTGKINDVGAYTRTNIPKSYRLGVELQGKIKFADWINVSANFSVSQNKIKGFIEYVDDYDNGNQQTKNYTNTNIAFSPNAIAGGSINILPIKNVEINMVSKYVGRQFLDNTSQKSRSLNGFFIQDIRLGYLLENKLVKATSFIVQLNNIFNKQYEPNGYTFSYIYDKKLTTENYYFPMAGFNIMVGINIKL
jgi:iron complex outermembrane receptor protein